MVDFYPDTSFEEKYAKQGYIVVGIDEVGRGALAGPITVAALALGPFGADFNFGALKQLKVKDSKCLSHRQRVSVAKAISSRKFMFSVASTNVAIINKKGIVYAFEQAVRSAVSQIRSRLHTKLPIFLLIDAFKVPYVRGVRKGNQCNIIKGDMRCFSIAAASILAKVERDTYMTDLSANYGAYAWQENKGYGTREHIRAIQRYGKTIHHRDLYLRKILQA